MAGTLPLPTKLSHALVAFTIEFDNEFEHRMTHRTTESAKSGDPGRGPWLTSQVLWANVMQYVPAAGIAVGVLHARARTTRDSLAGLQRWGYVVVDPWGASAYPRPDTVVSPTKAGRLAQKMWAPLAGVVEQRWEARSGAADVDRLRAALQVFVDRFDSELPQYLPIVFPTQNGRAEIPAAGRRRGATPADDLSALLAKVLLSFTLDFERESRISLPISANTLRVLDEAGLRVRDFPRLTGVSKEANSMAVGFLVRRECAVVEADPAATRGKVVRLTAKGRRAQDKYHRVLDATEQDWRTRFGASDVDELEAALGRFVDEPSLLDAGLTPYPDGWRASVRKPETLPHYPMVLHRGGYPDGS